MLQKEKFPQDILTTIGIPMIGEVLGVATFLFIGCMGCIPNTYPGASHQFMPFNFGLSIALAVQLYAHISGAHFNPIVTMAAVIMGNMKIVKSICYIIAQFIGAFIGYGLIMVLVPESSSDNLCVTVPSNGVTDVQALFVEAICSFFLVMALCTAWDPRLSRFHDSIALKIGLMLSGVFLAAAQFTGSGLNPARSLVPAIFHNVWDSHWVYWVGPIFGGGLVAPVLYRFVFLYGVQKEVSQHAKSSEKNDPI